MDVTFKLKNLNWKINYRGRIEVKIHGLTYK